MYYMHFHMDFISIWILLNFCSCICYVREVLWNDVQKGLNKGLSEDFYCHVGLELMFIQTQFPFSFIQILFTVSTCHIPRINPSHRRGPIQIWDLSWVILNFQNRKVEVFECQCKCSSSSGAIYIPYPVGSSDSMIKIPTKTVWGFDFTASQTP